jgi:hypothetical protein
MQKKTKIWLGVGAFVMVGSGVAVSGVAASQAEPAHDLKTHWLGSASHAGQRIQLAQAKDVPKEAAKPAEGGEGGEGKIDPAAVDADPIDYGVALQVIAAHYHAGLMAYEGGQQDAGTQMFAHGLAEVYVELEDIFKKRGVTDLGGKLNATLDAGNAKAPVREVRKRVAAVMASLSSAVKAGPASKKPAMAIKTEVMAEMLERSAQQYRVAAGNTDFESYLDGLGFTLAAQAEARDVMPWIRKQAPKVAAGLDKTLKFAAKAYPGIKRPKGRPVDPDKFLSAASEAHVAVSQLPN